MVQQYLILFFTLLLGGALKGATGLGTPIVAVPVLAAFFSVPYAIAVLLVPLFVTNVWQVWEFRAHLKALRFLPRLLVSAAIGIGVGTWLLTALPAELLALALALTTFLYIAVRLARPELAIGPTAALRWAVPVGLVAGTLQGATGVSAPVSVTFINGMRLSRPAFVATISMFFLTFSLALFPALSLAGVLTWERLFDSLLALIPIAAGMPLGSWAAKRMSMVAFDRLILALLAVIGTKLLWDAFS